MAPRFIFIVPRISLLLAAFISASLTSFSSFSEAVTFGGKCPKIGAGNVKYGNNGACQEWMIELLPVFSANTPDIQATQFSQFLIGMSANCKTSKTRVGVFYVPASSDQCSNMKAITDKQSISAIRSFNPNPSLSCASNGSDFSEILGVFDEATQCAHSNGIAEMGGVAFFLTNIAPEDMSITFASFITHQQDVLEQFQQVGYLFEMIVYYEKDTAAAQSTVESLFPSIVNSQYASIKVTSDVQSLSNSYLTCPVPTKSGGISVVALALAIAIPLFLLVVVALLCIFCFWKRLSKLKKAAGNVGVLPGEISVEAYMERRNAGQNNYVEMRAKMMEMKDEWEIGDWELGVYADTILGKGAFAVVYKGKLCASAVTRLSKHRTIGGPRLEAGAEVAVKALRPHADGAARADFFNEIDFMKSLGQHAHVLGLLAHVSNPDAPKIVMEYCLNDSLLKYLQKFQTVSTTDDTAEGEIGIKHLLSFSWQISDGMNYLSSMNIIHRDLAARNVLLTGELTAKISDFGLCRRVDESLYTARGGKLPLKWMALESLKRYEFTTLTDVWAFGVTLFEIYSLGDGPYPAIQPNDMIAHLEAGNRMARPRNCPQEIYDLMLLCWSEEPAERPTFVKIQEQFSKMLNESDQHYGYLSFEDDPNRGNSSNVSLNEEADEI